MERRLTAILATDVVGYSRLMELDEVGTLTVLKAHRRELIDPAITEHRGRIVKLMGDGTLVEFASVVDAVACAVAIQAGLAERNDDTPEDRRIELRIGVHLGDIIVEGADIYGEGVNVAARLEGLAEPGGICLSGDAYRQVRGKVEANFEDLGERQVKNLAEPLRVYRIATKGPSSTPSQAVTGSLPLPDKASIAVLPFDNMSSDPEQEFFADGISEDIITALSKISRMRVIARNSTFAYKGQALDLRRVAGELDVRYVLEGSIRRGGNRLRITAQLIDADSGSHVWAERYDRTVADLFDIQDEITKEIVTALRVKLTDGEEAFVLARGTDNIEAWQYCVRAHELFMRFNSSDYLEARVLAEKATRIDPNYAYAWATLGFTYWWDGRLGYTEDSDAKFVRANEIAVRAMALDDTVSWSIGLSAMVAAPLNRHDEGVDVARRGLELYPGNADVRAFLAFALLHAGNYREAAEHFRAAMSLNPFYPNWYRNGLARTLICLDELDEALALSDEILDIEPGFLQAWLQRAYIYGQTGREADSRNAIHEVRRLAPNLRVGHLPGLQLINDAPAEQRFLDAIRKAGLPD
jgi:TolB-like protein/Flp pilus assembly protein TadD